MVLLKKLNKECASRPVSRAIPAHIACRLLGNTLKPCQLDAICRPCGNVGVWLFYSTFLVAFGVIFFIVFWLLRITRLSKLLNMLAGLALPPIKWLGNMFAGMVKFYRNLPF